MSTPNDTQAIRRQRPRADALRRVTQAWQLRIAGVAWDDIAAQVGYSNAQNCIRAVRNYAGTLPEPSTVELRHLWRARLEKLWPIAERDVLAGKPGATRAAVALAQRAAAMDGLDSATRVEVSTDAAELEQIVRQIRVARGDLPEEADVLELEVLSVDE